MQFYISKLTRLRAGEVFRTLAGGCWVGGDENGGDGHAATAATSHMAWVASVSRVSLRETSGRRGGNLHISTSRMEMPSHLFAALKCVAMLSRSNPRFLLRGIQIQQTICSLSPFPTSFLSVFDLQRRRTFCLSVWVGKVWGVSPTCFVPPTGLLFNLWILTSDLTAQTKKKWLFYSV